MGKETGILWTSHTFNPIWGCTKVSPGCKFCYAETLSNRFGDDVWGINKERKTFGEKHWNEPLKWNRLAEKEGVRKRVFCGSMCDIFEDHPTTNTERVKVWEVIRATPMLDWQLLTKRPENIKGMLPEDWGDGYPNVWLGCSTENQEMAETRIPILAAVPAKVRFLSAEPLIGRIDFTKLLRSKGGHKYISKGNKHECAYGCGCGFATYQNWGPDGVDPDGYCPNYPKPIHWVIWGGESGHQARPMELEWIEDGIKVCKEQDIAVFVKQMGAHLAARMELNHKKGEDKEEWPEHIRIQEFPK